MIDALNQQQLLTFFTSHLDRIYCAKTHMVKSFPTMAAEAGFDDLKLAIEETTADVENQIARMDIVYNLLNTSCKDSSCGGLLGMLSESLEAINEFDGDTQLRDMSILFYIQNIESIEVTSFKILKMVAERLGNDEISQLLLENYDESTEDSALLLQINAKYL
jgi:ferritin-like metal-binding protein YciE